LAEAVQDGARAVDVFAVSRQARLDGQRGGGSGGGDIHINVRRGKHLRCAPGEVNAQAQQRRGLVCGGGEGGFRTQLQLGGERNEGRRGGGSGHGIENGVLGPGEERRKAVGGM
jgi:hypothetical protein